MCLCGHTYGHFRRRSHIATARGVHQSGSTWTSAALVRQETTPPCCYADVHVEGPHMYLYGAARLQNACRKMRGGAPSTTAGSTPVPRPPLGVLWAGSNRPWRARVAIYHPRRAAPLGAWAGPCAAVTWNFTYKTDGAGKAVFRQKRKKRSLAEKPPKTLTLHTKYIPTRPYKGRGA